MKEILIEEIKQLIAVNKDDNIEINPAYLEYFSDQELEDIRATLVLKKEQLVKRNGVYLDELYEKTKKDEI